MGKRKAARKPVKKETIKLDKQFTCHFCNHEKSIEVKLDRMSSVGTLSCRICGAFWQTNIHNLSDAVDVYGDWIDACEAVKDQQPVDDVQQNQQQDFDSEDDEALPEVPWKKNKSPAKPKPPPMKRQDRYDTDDDSISEEISSDESEGEALMTDEELEAKEEPVKRRRLVAASSDIDD